MTGPGALSATALVRETGITQQTLSRRLQAAGAVSRMATSDDDRGRRPQDWSAEEILEVITEAASLADEDLGAFLRRSRRRRGSR